jgi:hypothetical protein
LINAPSRLSILYLKASQSPEILRYDNN